MSINLIDLITKGMSGNIMSQLGTAIGANPDSATRGVASAIPAVLGGLLKTSSTTVGVSDLVYGMLKGNHDGLINNLGNTLAGGAATQNLLKTGEGVLGSIFGDRIKAVTDLVGSSAGLNQASSASLMGVMGPIVLGFITQHLRAAGGLNTASLAGLLGGQKAAVAAAAPAGLAPALGVASLDNYSAPSAAAAAVSDSGGSGWMKWVVGLVALLAVLFALRNCQTQKVEVPPPPPAPVVEAPAPPPPPPEDGLTAMTLPDGVGLRAAADGVESKLLAFITDSSKVVDKTTWFTMDRLQFETGSATLQDTSNAQLDNIAAILKAYPAVKLKVGGYTDNTGNAAKNLKLSGDRAAATVAALASRGVEAGRVEGAGYGNKFPVADNATEDGRQKNRRTDLRVTAK